MKKFLSKFFLISCLLISSLTAFAGGGITHMYVAEAAINQISDSQLRNLLHDNLDAFLVGAYYPDSGYLGKGTYGELSHWDDFIYAFANHLIKKYKNPAQENPKLTAFLFGCATHRVSDEIIHRKFYPEGARHDFPGDGNKMHDYGDVGIDLLINVDKNKWFSQPKKWWVPLSDLLEVYQSMGLNIDKNDIISGNQIISLAGPAERMVALPAYPYLWIKMPWTAAHYFNSPQGGVQMDTNETTKYLMKLWGYLQKSHPRTHLVQMSAAANTNPVVSLAEKLIAYGIMRVPVHYLEDGSIEIAEPVLLDEAKMKQMIDSFFKNFFK